MLHNAPTSEAVTIGLTSPPDEIEAAPGRGGEQAEASGLDAAAGGPYGLTHVLAAQAEASIDGILIVDEAGEIVYSNHRFVELWGFPDATVRTGPDAPILQMALERVADPGVFLARVQQLYRHPGETSRDDVALKDGRVFDRYSAPILGPDGGHAGRVWFFHEVTRRARAEAELLESRQSLEAIINCIADPVFVKGTDRRFRLVNDAMCTMMGAPRAAILGKRDADFFPLEQVSVFLRRDALVLATGIPDVNEEMFTGADGEARAIVTKKTRHTDSAGQSFIVGVIRDVTEQMRDKKARLASEERFEQVAEAAGEWIWEVDAGGLYTYSSRGVEALLGYAPEELVGRMHFYDLFAPDVREALKRAALETFSGGRPFGGFPNPNVHRDGTIVFLETSGAPVLDAGGNVIGYRGADTDITARRRAEERISSLAAAVEQSADDSIVIDLEGRIQYVNPAFERTTGYTLEEAVGQEVNDLLCRDLDEALLPKIWESIRQGRPWKGRFSNRTKDGDVVLLDGTVSAIRSPSGAITGYVSARRDVTKQVELEARLSQAQKLEAIGTLAGGIAHDFNNILTAIVGNTQLVLRKYAGDPVVQTDLGVVLQGAQRATDLVKQILMFSRHTLHEESPVQAGLIVEETAKFLRATVPTTIEIRTDVRSTSAVMADPSELHRIIMNLSMNAILAMNQREGLLEIGLTDVDVDLAFAQRFPALTPGRFLRLRVRDTGHGMGREVIECIFEPFFTTREVGMGTGMGLAVVHGIVTRLSGAITVESEVGKGTTFELYLPVARVAVPEAVASGAEFRRGAERVLVVDDDPLVLETMADMLRELGYQVRQEKSGAAAQAAFEADPQAFDLVITDMTMPGVAGDALAKWLKQRRPGLPVVLCSGYTEDQIPEGIGRQGIDEFLMKPVFMGPLAQLLRRMLDASCDRSGPAGMSGELPARP